MAFVYLDDKFPDHPKVDPLTDGAFRLHVAAICYCGRHLTDGIIPADRVARLIPRFRRAYLDELTRVKVWVDLGDRYQIHDYLEWNASRAEVEQRREQRAKSGRKGAQNRWGK